MFVSNRLKLDNEQKINRCLNMAKLFYLNKDYAMAKSHINELISLKPDSYEAYKMLSQINEACGESDLAIQNFKKSLELKIVSDHNSSFENNQFNTPTKVSPPVVNNKNDINQSQIDIASNVLEKIEKLFEKKMGVYDKKIDNLCKKFESVITSVHKNNQDVDSINTRITDLDNKIQTMLKKQELAGNKEFLTERNFKDYFNQIIKKMETLSEDTSRLFVEFENIKDLVKINNENYENYDEEYEDEEYNDYENENSQSLISSTKPLTFGLAQPPTNQSLNLNSSTNLPNLNVLFKPKIGEWECTGCYVPNSNSENKCVSCEMPRDGLTITNNQTPKFNGFGNSEQSKFPSELFKNSNSVSTFTNQNGNPFSFGSQNTFNFGNTFTSNKPPIFGNVTNQSSFFKFPMNQENKPNEELSNENKLDESVDDKENDQSKQDVLYKLPNVDLPENYEQVTGEEDETELYKNKCKLYIHTNDEYKERGVGILKILKHNKTSKIRILMRRDTVFKVCLNSYLSNIKDLEIVNKFLRFSCIDFSEDMATPCIFLLKFSSVDIRDDFKTFIEGLLNNSTNTEKTNNGGTLDEEVEIIYEKEPKPEHKSIILKLKLPKNFFEEKSPCKGCIGCRVDELKWDNLTQNLNIENKSEQDSVYFSSLTSNLPQTKVDNISEIDSAQCNDENTQNYVSHKSKLLPTNYQHKTGEEDLDVLFLERAKLYRFDTKTSEWKERGKGEMKILKVKDKDEFRLLMRRDIVLKTICNHKVFPKLCLKEFNSKGSSLTWGAIDFSENVNGINEIFVIKFANATLMNKFKTTVEECIAKLS